MFNLLVKYNPWGDDRDTIPASRAFEHTERALIDRLKPGGRLDFDALCALPTLFMQETSGQRDQVARVGTITRARISGFNIALDFSYDPGVPPFPNQALQGFAVDLDIEDFEFARTHWAVKDVDLYRALLRNAQPRRQRPSVFHLAEYEDVEPSLISAMMPFRPAFDAVYATLQRAAAAVGLRCRRADDIWENPAVIQDVVSLIDRSRVVICDCTGRNPNVFYEIGIAHTLGREVILITQAEADICGKTTFGAIAFNNRRPSGRHSFCSYRAWRSHLAVEKSTVARPAWGYYSNYTTTTNHWCTFSVATCGNYSSMEPNIWNITRR